MKALADSWVAPAARFPAPAQGFVTGTFDVRVFMQDEFWVDDAGRSAKLDNMDASYLMDVLTELFHAAETHQDNVLDWYGSTIMEFMARFVETNETQRLALLSEANICVEAAPQVWLAQTPLVKRINVLLG
jgi:hypothetical protein